MRRILLFLFALTLSAAPAWAQTEAELLVRLADTPEDAEARLALARIYFEDHEDRAAEFNARQALADRLSPESAEAARELLAALQRRRTWIVTADFSVSPQLQPDPSTGNDGSGLGLSAAGSVERRQVLAESLRLSAEVQGYAAAYENGDYDDYSIVALLGPLWLQRGDDLVSLRALAQRRWYGGEEEYSAVGGELAAQRSFGDRIRAIGSLTVRDLEYDTANLRDGWDATATADIQRFGPRGAFDRAFAVLGRTEAEASWHSWWFTRLGVGAYREFGWGIGVYVEPSAAVQTFNGADPVAGGGRTDWLLSGRLRVVKRDWRLFDSSPFAEFEVTRIDSNVRLYDRTDKGVVLGLTRTF